MLGVRHRQPPTTSGGLVLAEGDVDLLPPVHAIGGWWSEAEALEYQARSADSKRKEISKQTFVVFKSYYLTVFTGIIAELALMR